MDKRINRTVALLSIHPIYANRLLNETKGVELRKTKISQKVDYIVIYSTSPVQKIVGYFSIEKITVNSPSEIWREYQQTSGINRAEFHTYYANSKQAVAIEVAEMYPLKHPAPLSILGEGMKPPQSFQYLDYSSIALISGYVPENCQSIAR